MLKLLTILTIITLSSNVQHFARYVHMIKPHEVKEVTVQNVNLAMNLMALNAKRNVEMARSLELKSVMTGLMT